MTQGTGKRGWKRWGAGAALLATGVLAGGVIAAALPASAVTTATGTTAATATDTGTTRTVDESKSQRSDETLLTGDAATKVRTAALAKYPGATIQRIETDSDGVYEAHLTTAAGARVTVELGKDFAVTGTEAGGGHGGGHGAPGERDDD
jgi:hypothetical protein